MTKVLLFGLLLAGCGEVSAAGVAIGDDGAAGAMAGAGGGGSSGGQAGTSGAGGGTGTDALPPSCAYTPDMITGGYTATFNSAKATSVNGCAARMVPVTIDHGQLTSAALGEGSSVAWDISGFSSSPDGPACDIGIYFKRDTTGCGAEHISVFFTLPAF